MGDITQVEPRATAPVPVSFPQGNTISEAFDLEGFQLAAFFIPDDYDGGATLNFLVAARFEDPVYKPLVGATGTAVQVTGVVAGRVISVGAVLELKNLRFMKLVSATGVAAKRTIQAMRQQGA
jgi:hypothetical protein